MCAGVPVLFLLLHMCGKHVANIYLTFFGSGRDKLAVDPRVWKRGEGKGKGKVGYWFVREDWSGKQEQGAIKTSFKKSFCFLREKK